MVYSKDTLCIGINIGIIFVYFFIYTRSEPKNIDFVFFSWLTSHKIITFKLELVNVTNEKRTNILLGLHDHRNCWTVLCLNFRIDFFFHVIKISRMNPNNVFYKSVRSLDVHVSCHIFDK
jgi:hypothetical protein